MRKKDMYISYRKNVRRSGLTIAIYIVCVALIAAGLGFGVYFGIKYFENRNNPVQVGEEETPPEQGPEAASGAAVTAALTEEGVTQAGPFGMWYANSDDAEPDLSPFEPEVWMADFDDKRERIDSKGIYVSPAFAERNMSKAIDLVDRTELNTIVLDIKTDKGIITFDMDYDEAKAIGATTRVIADIDGLVKTCKEHGIYLIGRIVSLMDPKLAEERPELALKTKSGTIFRDRSGAAWVNPYKKEVWDYLEQVAVKTAEAGFNEINFDYIRFSSEGGMKDVDFGEDVEEMSRIDVITAGIKRMCETLKPMGVFVSCDVYGAIISSQLDAKIVGQSYRQMASYLDYICPMVYPSHYGDGYYNLDHPDLHPYELVSGAMGDSKKVLSTMPTDENKAQVRPWLQDFTASWLRYHKEYGKNEVLDQKKAVYESGYTGWLLWNAACDYSEGALTGD
ncbi:MAG: putative glycoside hydrolase [Lachnospiraceae bacterium]|nr:putative glycoside hydrolase [Lachnospiraceae bacterium]